MLRLRLPLRLPGRRLYATFQSCHQHDNRLAPPPNSTPERKSEKELISLIKSSTQKSHLLQIHAQLLHSHHLHNPRIFLHFLSRVSLPPLQNLQYCREIFHRCRSPDVSMYGVMIRAHSKNISSSSLGFELYREMLRLGLPSDGFCSLSAVKCCVKKKGMFSSGLQVHGRVLKDGFRSNAVLLTTLMDFYSLNGKGYEACKVFDEIPDRDTAAWNVLLSCFIRNRRMKDALSAFEVMEKSTGIRPNDVSCLLVLDACAKLNALKFGERVHGYVKECGMENFEKIQNKLVNMYSKCGSVEKAYEVFLRIPEKDVVTWSAMISGLASNGHGREAFEAFKDMQRMNIPSNDQTCTAVLLGCSRAGLVQEGRMFFKFMVEELGIVPNLYHYGCMVDMLGRAGFLDEAYELIRSMAIKPDAVIWRTLLVACRNHKKTDLGGRVAEHLIKMRAEEAGDYVLLVNLYSSPNNLEKVEEVQKCMKEKGVQASYKVAVLGAAGGIGQPLALLIKMSPLVSALNLYDIANVKGVAADLSHCNTPSQVSDFTGDKELASCLKDVNVVVIPVGVPRKPGMTRDDLFNINASIVKNLVEAVADNCPDAFIHIISNPVNSTVPIAAEVLKKKGVYNPKKLFGVTTLDVVRANTFVAQKKKLRLIDVDVPVIGGHAGITILPLLSKTKPSVTFTDEEVHELTVRIQNAGTEVVEAKAGAGSAALSMAYAAARFVESSLRALDGDSDVYECSYIQTDESDLQFFASRIKLGKDGVEAVIKSDLQGLTEYEEKALEALKPELKASIEKGINFVNKQAVAA